LDFGYLLEPIVEKSGNFAFSYGKKEFGEIEQQFFLTKTLRIC
jgi:hypothetical protein